MSSIQPFDHYLQSYGDLLFDLCESLLWESPYSSPVFLSILKDIQRDRDANTYSLYERSWVLQVACSRLLSAVHKHGRGLTASEQIELDSTQNIAKRLTQFTRFFRRLPPEDQLLLLLRDKYNLPYPEIASAMETPEDSLKMRRQQALTTLEEWIWGTA